MCVLYSIYIVYSVYSIYSIYIVYILYIDRSIEEITSQVHTISIMNEYIEFIPKEVAIWNPTVANLSLMALGSSAPKILLSVIETINNLGKPAGELGPSTIAFWKLFLLLLSCLLYYSSHMLLIGKELCVNVN